MCVRMCESFFLTNIFPVCKKGWIFNDQIDIVRVMGRLDLHIARVALADPLFSAESV